jgi:dephospho-CoA kinase
MTAKIVLTGGPCAGKTSCLRAIRAEFGEQVVTVPEVATLLLNNGFPLL